MRIAVRHRNTDEHWIRIALQLIKRVKIEAARAV
jgi:hypothetical protein